MKKTNVFGAIFIMAVVLFTSCLDGGSNSENRVAAGVIGYAPKNFKTVMYVSNDMCFYSPAFENMVEGTCCFANYERDFDLPENSNEAVAANGYYTVKVLQKAEVEQFQMTYGLTDTATLLPKETPITNPIYEMPPFVKGRLFLTHQIKQPEDQKTTFNLSYDPQFTNIEKGTNGNIYDVFLRATVKSEGSKTSEERFLTNAYNMKDYFDRVANREKGLGNKAFDIRFNYVSAIDTVKKSMTWKQANTLTTYVATILPE